MHCNGTMHRDSAELFWKYIIIIKSKGFRGYHRMGPPEADPGTSACSLLVHEGSAFLGDK